MAGKLEHRAGGLIHVATCTSKPSWKTILRIQKKTVYVTKTFLLDQTPIHRTNFGK